MTPLANLLILAFVGSVAGLIGGVVLILKKSWANSLSTYATPLAAGVLLAVSLLDLLPEAVEAIDSRAFGVVLIVFVVLFLFERIFFNLHHHNNYHKRSHSGAIPLVIFGDTIHNFLDGVAIAAAFLINPSLAVVVAFSTFLHETPHEIADFGILIEAGWSKSKAFFANFASALATFPGALLTYFYAGKIESGVGILLAIAAGLFLYVAATDFLPEAEHSPKKHQAVFVILGILIIYFLQVLIPEVH